MSLLAADTTWPEAAIAISGVALVGAVVCIVVWQAMATWRTRIERGARDRKEREQ
jgi:hypothetical protein